MRIMDPFKGVMIQVLSNGQILTLHDDPDAAEVEDERTRNHYIEAVTDATFTVKVKLTSQFSLDGLRDLDAVEIRLNLDGQPLDWTGTKTRTEIESNLLKGRPAIQEFTRAIQYCHQSDRWIEGDYAFGKLEISITPKPASIGIILIFLPEEASTVRLTGDRVKDLGRLKITVQRVQQKKLSTPRPPQMLSQCAVKEIDEKALKGRGIANSIT